jgi:hypothetical protein
MAYSGQEFFMTGEIEKYRAGAPQLKKTQEEQIRHEVTTTLPHLGPEAQEAVIQSRLKILHNSDRPELVQVDLSENASRTVKDNLFE